MSPEPAAHVQKIKELFASGATVVNIHSGEQDQQRVIDFYAREVLPQLKSTTAAGNSPARH